MVPTYPEARNELVSAANSVDYAYRETGEGPVPLVLLQHSRAAEADRVALPIGAAGLRRCWRPRFDVELTEHLGHGRARAIRRWQCPERRQPQDGPHRCRGRADHAHPPPPSMISAA